MSTSTQAPPRSPVAPGPKPARRSSRPTVKPMVSLLGAVCVLAGSTALLVVVNGAGWLASAIQVVGLVWLIGVGCRLLGAVTPVTVLAQVAGVVVTLTAVFTNSGWAGLIPNPAAVKEADALLSGAWDQILHSSLPAPSSQELSFLIAIAVGLTAIIVDFFVSEVEAPALVALPLLCLYSVPASIAEELLPWWAFALPAAAYLVLIAVAGHPGRRMGLRAGIGVAVAAVVVALASIAGSLVVADSVTVIGTEGRVQRTNALSAGSDVGLSTFASLHGDLQRGEATNVLRIRGLPAPDYLRTTALENWDPTQGFSLADPTRSAVGAGSAIGLQPLANNPAAQTSKVDVEILGYQDRFVPFYQGTTEITGLGDGYNYNALVGSVFRDSPAAPPNYEMTVQYGAIDPALLRADTSSATAAQIAADGVPATARTLAETVTAGGATTFDKALLMSQYFTDPANGFVYSLNVPTGNSGDLLSDFLTQKQGYCEQYAAAMAIMLRSINIPARVAIGFTQGTQVGDQEFLITSHDAHAWVEVHFDHYGWVRFDPTPLANVGNLPGYQTSGAGEPENGSSTAATSGGDSAAATAASQNAATVTDFETVGPGAGAAGVVETSWWKHWYSWALLIVVALGLLAVAPGLWRRRLAARRLAEARSGGPRAPAAAWSEVEALATDHGLPTRSGVSVRRAANQLAHDGQLSERGRAGLRRIALSTEAAWYSPGGYTAADADLAADVEQIAADLRRSAPQTMGTKLLPRSLVDRR